MTFNNGGYVVGTWVGSGAGAQGNITTREQTVSFSSSVQVDDFPPALQVLP